MLPDGWYHLPWCFPEKRKGWLMFVHLEPWLPPVMEQRAMFGYLAFSLLIETLVIPSGRKIKTLIISLMEGWWVEVSPFCTCLNLKPLHSRELPAAGGGCWGGVLGVGWGGGSELIGLISGI